MIDAWQFTQPETWTRVECALPDWPDDLALDAYMALLGYKVHSSAPNSDLVDFVGCWHLYTAVRPEAPAPCALMVEGADAWALVLLPTVPDLLAYMARYGEVGQARWHAEELQEVHALLTMGFQAWHGHEPFAFCRECDPGQQARWEQKQAERRAQKGA
jgi:hypothetical protein